jgi:hypothetical protein
MIIAAHAGTGKTTLAKIYPAKFVDFICMPYKYHLPKSLSENENESCKANSDNDRNWEYPYNYFEAIKEAMADRTLIIPPDLNVLYLLREEKIPYFLCYPVREAKEVYRKRYIERGNTEDFLSIFIDRWDSFIDGFEADDYGRHIVMQPHQFLSDVFDEKMLILQATVKAVN